MKIRTDGAEFRLDATPGESGPVYMVLDRRDGCGMYLQLGDVRKIRDTLNEHLGETQKSLPVGTIVVGEGLTEAQKTFCGEAVEWEKLEVVLDTVSWLRTQEGSVFWGTVRDRVQNIVACMKAEKKRNEVPKPDYVQGVSVATTGEWISVGMQNVLPKRSLTPGESRTLATALIKHADAAEKKSSQG